MKNNSAGVVFGVVLLFIFCFIGMFNSNSSSNFDYDFHLSNQLMKEMIELPQLDAADFDIDFRQPSEKRDLGQLLEDWHLNAGSYTLDAEQSTAFLKEYKNYSKVNLRLINRYIEVKIILWNWEEENVKTLLISYPSSTEGQAFEYCRIKDGEVEHLRGWDLQYFDRDCKRGDLLQTDLVDKSLYFYIDEQKYCKYFRKIYKAGLDDAKEVYSFTSLYIKRFEEDYYSKTFHYLNDQASLKIDYPDPLTKIEKSLNIPLIWDTEAEQFMIKHDLYYALLEEKEEY